MTSQIEIGQTYIADKSGRVVTVKGMTDAGVLFEIEGGIGEGLVSYETFRREFRWFS